MAWISVHQAVWTHRKTFALADRLSLSETYAGAHLVRLWTWALDNAGEHGEIGASPRMIAKSADWTGDAEAFVEALVECGWLDHGESGYAIHDWEDYAGKLIEKRKTDAERLRRWRASREDTPDETRSETPASPDETRSVAVGETRTKRVSSRVTVPNLTVPNSTEPELRGFPAPAGATPENPVGEVSQPAPEAPPVPVGVPKPQPAQNKYGGFLRRVGELARERGVEILIRGPSSRNGSAVKDSPYTAEQLAAAVAAYEAGEWTNDHIAKCGHPVWAVVEGSGLWLERDRLGVNGHAKTRPGAGGPDRAGRPTITADPRAFSGIDRG